ncbi:MAG: hypothetical protein RL685_860 [Pseudomonadota bacterium]
MDPNLYVNDDLGFSLRKPEAWTFLPTAWSLKFRTHLDPSNEELARVLELASVPFVHAYLPHADPTSAFPTLQASCRATRTRVEPRDLLAPMIEQLQRQFADLGVLEASSDAIVAGRPALRLKTTFSVQNDEGTSFRCSSHSYTLLAPPLAFSIGISCAASGQYFLPDDLASIAASLRIRTRGRAAPG